MRLALSRFPQDGEFLDASVGVTAVGVDVLADLVEIPPAELVGDVPLRRSTPSASGS